MFFKKKEPTIKIPAWVAARLLEVHMKNQDFDEKLGFIPEIKIGATPNWHDTDWYANAWMELYRSLWDQHRRPLTKATSTSTSS